MLQTANARLAIAPLGDGDITAIWSGVRPLIAQPGKTASEVSRKDELWTSPGGLVSIAGGKLSAYRAMAERVLDLAVERLGISARPCSTAEIPLPGGGPVAAETDARLATLYGDDAGKVLGGVAVEAAWAVTHEGATRLEDYWVRRSGRAWFDADAGRAVLEPAAAAMGALLGWDADERSTQVAACLAIDADSRGMLGAQQRDVA